jgi:hypothetical protein
MSKESNQRERKAADYLESLQTPVAYRAEHRREARSRKPANQTDPRPTDLPLLLRQRLGIGAALAQPCVVQTRSGSSGIYLWSLAALRVPNRSCGFV